MIERESRLSATPRRADGVWLARRDGENVLHDGTGQKLCVVNDTAAALWELCDGATTVEEMISAIRQYWSVEPDAAAAEILQALVELQGAGTLEPHSPSQNSGAAPAGQHAGPAIEEDLGTS